MHVRCPDLVLAHALRHAGGTQAARSFGRLGAAAHEAGGLVCSFALGVATRCLQGPVALVQPGLAAGPAVRNNLAFSSPPTFTAWDAKLARPAAR
jgi:hypothetical protein